MPKGRIVAWLAMMWLISGFAGFNLAFGISNGLVILAVFGLVMSLAALGGSLLPLAYGLGLWEEPEAQVAPPPSAVFEAPPPQQPPAPVYQQAPRAIVHEAGTPSADLQVCTRCGTVLCDFSDSTAAPPAALPAGAWVAETQDFFYQLESNHQLGPDEALCTEQPSNEWEALKPRAGQRREGLERPAHSLW